MPITCAMYAVYCLARIDIDGKEMFTFGVDDEGKALQEPRGDSKEKKQLFFDHMRWDYFLQLMTRADLLSRDESTKIRVKQDRMLALLSLTAVHDVMKNPECLPRVHKRYAPYDGYDEGKTVTDHGHHPVQPVVATLGLHLAA